MVDIDGSYGEGGGQLLRTAVALAAITRRSVRVRNIRAKRSNPGLAPQHLAAVKAVASLCGAGVVGLEVHSRDILFKPGSLRGGQFDFPVGTAGSITLVLQQLFLWLSCAVKEQVCISPAGPTCGLRRRWIISAMCCFHYCRLWESRRKSTCASAGITRVEEGK